MSPSSRFLPLSSPPPSTSQIDPVLTQQPPNTTLHPPASLPSHDPSFHTAPEEKSQTRPASTSPLHAPPSPETKEEEDDDDEETSVASPPATTIPPPPPNFAPYFTLLSSHPATTTEQSTTYHPTVRYIFADDPPDSSPIADAALDLLDLAGGEGAEDQGQDQEDEEEDQEGGEDGGEDEDDEGGKGNREGKTPAPPRKERYILLEMDASGTKVRSAKSMSPDWAVTGAEVGMAPTWEGDGGVGGGGGGGGGGGWMLKVEGVEAFGRRSKGVTKRHGEERGLEELVEEYERRMRELRRVIEAGAASEGEEGGKDD